MCVHSHSFNSSYSHVNSSHSFGSVVYTRTHLLTMQLHWQFVKATIFYIFIESCTVSLLMQVGVSCTKNSEIKQAVFVTVPTTVRVLYLIDLCVING